MLASRSSLSIFYTHRLQEQVRIMSRIDLANLKSSCDEQVDVLIWYLYITYLIQQ